MADTKEAVETTAADGSVPPTAELDTSGATTQADSGEQPTEPPQQPPAAEAEVDDKDGETTSWIPKTVTGFFSGMTADHEEVGEEDDGETNNMFGEEVQKTAEMISKDLEMVSRDVTKNVAKVGEEIGKGWAGFNRFIDGVLNDGIAPDDSEQLQDTFVSCFPELKDEDVIDAFYCTVVQKYRCYHNSATPEKSFPFHGRLYITVNHAAFFAKVDEANLGVDNFPLIIKFDEVEKIQTGQSNMLRLLMQSKASFVLTNFPAESDYTGALSLLEHVLEQKKNPKPPATTPADSTDVSAEKAEAST